MPLPNNTYFLDKETEADTCRKFVLPKLYESDWTNEQIAEQRYFTAGKIIISGRKGRRTKAKRTDYLLRYTTNFPLAVVEAKASYKTAADGLEQAKEYAQLLGLKFAYATNGIDIIEFDFATGLQTSKENFPTPSELLQRWQEQESCTPKALELLIKPLRPNPDKPLRYYQEIAINRALQAILSGRKRLLLTLATGTGKTSVAFQIAYKLWENRWNRNGEHRRPKILFLADRGVLVDEPHNKDFAVFGEARCIMPDNGFPTSREMYFSTYQALAEDANREGAFRKFPPNFFDLIIIDECHRGSASDESSWRAILDYFTGAVQLGLTATPLRDDNKDTYEYFGNPLYTYSLKQGIADGFLAPYLLHRIVTNIDATGFRAESGAKDIHGQELPDSEFTTRDFEITLSHLPRTKAVAKERRKNK